MTNRFFRYFTETENTGMITAEESKKVEDTAITDLVEKQKKAGYHVITDGGIWNLTMHVPADSSVCPMYLKTRKWFWDSLRLNPRSWRTKQL